MNFKIVNPPQDFFSTQTPQRFKIRQTNSPADGEVEIVEITVARQPFFKGILIGTGGLLNRPVKGHYDPSINVLRFID